MAQFRVTVVVPVAYVFTVTASDEDQAMEIAEGEFPGLPHIGDKWEEDGEPEFTVTEVSTKW